mgnify:CR=1 FL=1
MSWDDKSDKKGRKNPWGSADNNDNRGEPKRNPWNGGNGGGGQEPPDLDDMIRRAKQNFESVMPGGFQGGGIIGLGLLVILLLWLASGMYIVNPAEQAVIQRLGAWSRTQSEPGLGYHLPAPIETMSKVNVAELRRMSIGFTENFSNSGRGTKQDMPEESLMLTADRNIIDLDLVILWRIKSAEDFLFNIEDQENTIKKVAESAIRDVVGQTQMFPIITRDRTTVADRAREIIQANLDEYKSGIQITQVLIDKAEVHPDVQSAFQDVQSAKQDAEDVKNRADEYRNKIIPEARGLAIQMGQEAQAYKQSTISKANGDADRFNSIYQSYLGGKDVTKERIYIETMEEVLKNAQKIIIGNEGNQGVVPYLPLNELIKTTGSR